MSVKENVQQTYDTGFSLLLILLGDSYLRSGCGQGPAQHTRRTPQSGPWGLAFWPKNGTILPFMEEKESKH